MVLVVGVCYTKKMWKRRRSFREHAIRFPVKEVEFVQLERGDGSLHSFDIWGARSFLFRVQTSPNAILTQVPHPEWMGFLFPISWRDEYKVDGRSAKPEDVFLLDGREEITTAAAERDVLLVGVLRNELTGACAALAGTDWWDFGRGNRALTVRDGSGRLFRQITAWTMMAASYEQPVAGRQMMSQTHEDEFISAIAKWYVSHVSDAERVRHDVHDELRIVRLAREAIHDSDVPAVCLAELCAACGVGQTSLHRAFTNVCGVSPGRYLKLQRLSAAREAFLDLGNLPRSVKEVSTALGFVGTGRFAREYMALFDELPKQTLRRSRA